MCLHSLLHTKRPFPASLCAHTNFGLVFQASVGKDFFLNAIELKKSRIFFAISQKKVVTLWEICFRALRVF